MFPNLLVHMEYKRSPIPNLRATWQNQSYMHVAVITSNPSHAQPFQKLRVSCKHPGQSILYTVMFLSVESAWTCHCHVYVSLANQQCKQAGNLTNSVTYKLHKQKAYLYMTHYHVLEFAHDMHWQYLCWVVSCSFHAMLCKCFPGNKSRILKEHAAIKICKWMCWSSNSGERNQNSKYLQGYAYIQPSQGADLAPSSQQ